MTETSADPIATFEAVRDALDNADEIGRIVANAFVDPEELDDYSNIGDSEVHRVPEHIAEVAWRARDFVRFMPFACSDHEYIDNYPEVKVSSFEVRHGDDWVSVGTVKNFDADLLCSHCGPAGFGDLRTNENVVDPAVRVALELDLDRVRFGGDGAFPSKKLMAAVLAKAGRRLRRRFVAVPSKLNVYRTGSFFKCHVDTPKDAAMLGTLVISISNDFAGGELVVRHHGEVLRSQMGRLEWVALYGDCEHEVLEVESGTRVTLTYALYAAEEQPTEDCDDSGGNDEDSPVGEKRYRRTRMEPRVKRSKDNDGRQVMVAPPTSAQLPKVCGDFAAAVDGFFDHPASEGYLGFVLSHQYTLASLFDTANLKGCDRSIYDCFASRAEDHPRRYRLHLLPVARRIEIILGGGEDGDNEIVQDSVCAFELDGFGLPGADFKYTDLVPFVNLGGSRLLLRDHDKGAEYTGNESRDGLLDSRYFAAALILEKTSVTSGEEDEDATEPEPEPEAGGGDKRQR